MSDKLYDLMDWARIEGLVYSEEDDPCGFLGAHAVPEGILVQAFWPDAKAVSVITGKKSYPMTLEDEAGFFAALLPGKRVPAYRLRITDARGEETEREDPYRFSPAVPEKELTKFAAGIAYQAYEWLGAHPARKNDVDGVSFAVWAPNAVRVSVVGDFNHWDGRALPMERLGESGVFSLFVPGLEPGVIYKYEIKAKGGLTYLKADPYGFASEVRPDDASVVASLEGFSWSDEAWEQAQAQRSADPSPMAIYELHLGSFARPDDGREFYTYRELAHLVTDYVKEMGYTHIALMPVMEYPDDATAGYQTGGFYAPTSRYGSPQDFMYFVDTLHQHGIGVLMDWVPAQFTRHIHSLGGFDGTNLYEHQDPRRGQMPGENVLLFNFGRPQVRSFLLANALYWTKVYHVDGLRVANAGSLLHHSYGRVDGQWVANLYGGSEHLEGIDFLKHLTSMFRSRLPGKLLIAKEDTAWPKVTGALDEDGLGFSMKWNDGWENDFLGYLQLDPVFRGYHHGDLLFSMIYYYSEKFLIGLDHDQFTAGKGCMLEKMPGRRELKFANLRAAYGYLFTHPGKKLLFMGQDLGLPKEWDPAAAVDWEDGKTSEHEALRTYLKALLALYQAQPALYELDFDPDGFEWINDISANENMLVFLRKGKREEDTLLVVCNFSPLTYEAHKIGVPFAGKYKEIFNSDSLLFGGQGAINPRLKSSRADECDGRAESIRIKVPPMGISIFSCQRIDRPASENEKAKKSQRRISGREKNGTREASANAAARTKGSLKETLQRRVEEEER